MKVDCNAMAMAFTLGALVVLGCNAPPEGQAAPSETTGPKTPSDVKGAVAEAPAEKADNAPLVPSTPDEPSPDKAQEGALKLSEKKDAGKAAVSDGKSLEEAKRLVDVMEGELKRATAAMQLAGKDKERVKEIGDEFQRLNKGLSKKIEAISEKLTSAELVAYEDYARERVGPAVQNFIQTVFKLGGFNQAMNEKAKEVVSTPPTSTPSAAPAPVLNPVPKDPRVIDPSGAQGDPLALPARGSASADGATGDSVTFAVAKAAVDGMAAELRGVVEKVRAAKGDSNEIRKVSQEYKEVNRRHAAMFPALISNMKPGVKAAFGEYVKSTLVPVSTELMAVFTDSGMTLAE